MKEWLPNFLAYLHKDYLKRLRFKKSGRTFSRDMGTYWERFNFQGSMQNYPGVPYWRFYVNVGIEFKDLAPRTYWSLFSHTHWAERLEQVVAGPSAYWEYNSETDLAALADDLVGFLLEASRNIASKSDSIRASCVRGENKTFHYL